MRYTAVILLIGLVATATASPFWNLFKSGSEYGNTASVEAVTESNSAMTDSIKDVKNIPIETSTNDNTEESYTTIDGTDDDWPDDTDPSSPYYIRHF